MCCTDGTQRESCVPRRSCGCSTPWWTRYCPTALGFEGAAGGRRLRQHGLCRCELHLTSYGICWACGRATQMQPSWQKRASGRCGCGACCGRRSLEPRTGGAARQRGAAGGGGQSGTGGIAGQLRPGTPSPDATTGGRPGGSRDQCQPCRPATSQPGRAQWVSTAQLAAAAERSGASKLRRYVNGDRGGGALVAANLGPPAAYLSGVQECSRQQALAEWCTGSFWNPEETRGWQRLPGKQRLCPHCLSDIENAGHIHGISRAAFKTCAPM